MSEAPIDARVLAASGQQGWRGMASNGRSLLLALFASLGGVLYGYNQGVFGQVQVMAEFEDRYYETMSDPTLRGLITGVLELGAAVGALAAGPCADRFSRKYTISAFCVIFILGAALQAGATRDVGFIYAGRTICGLGVGALSMLVPMYNAELAPPGIRGSLVALQQLAITFGILIAYWIGYGTNFIGGTTVPGQSSAAWRIPLALQIAPAIVLCIGSLFLPFSPRWLMLKGREDECLQGLSNLRRLPASDPKVQYEYRGLLAERLTEKEAAVERYGAEELNWRVSFWEYKRLLTTKTLLHRLSIGAGAQFFQQWTGINAIIYYAPIIFRQIGLTGDTVPLLATGLVGIVNFLFTFPAVFFVDNFNRRTLMAGGEISMCICLAGVAAIIAVYGDRFETNVAAGNGAVFLIFWYIISFAMTWGPLPFIVASEVFPLDMRGKGMSVSFCINWLFNFTVAKVTPPMIENIGYKTYLVFFTLSMVGLLWSIFILPELRGLSLEELDSVFRDTSGAEDMARRQRVADRVGLHLAAEEVGEFNEGKRDQEHLEKPDEFNK